MKRICLILLAVALMCFAGCGKEKQPEEMEQVPVETQPEDPGIQITWMTLPEDRVLTAQQYFVYDCNAGEFLTISGTADERIYPASVTKLFTAYIALTHLSSQESITAGDVLDLVPYGSSVAELEKGDALTVGELTEAMLLPSGNDAAYVLAEAAGRKLTTQTQSDPVAAFVAEMNNQAKILGMTGTHFANPDGIHSDDHYTTFADVAMIGLLALEDPVIMNYAKISRDTKQLNSGEKQWKNTNALIDQTSQYYCPYAIGLKTGQTPTAGSCLLTAFRCEEQTLLIGVFGCPEEDDRFVDTIQLFNEYLQDE